ncbi:MAG: methionyl-tRNA formyltransferase [Candidatus Omnitrophota bacterium]|nr:methionyl-tRNA formyltransferase [Candidatus Omnitrophota bacterium]
MIFFGTSAFAVPSLERLVNSHHVVPLCVTQPDRRQGRGLQPAPSPVKHIAIRLGVPVAQPERLHGAPFAGLHVDAGVVVAYGCLIPHELLRDPAHGMLGVHPSLLPRYRGAAPVARALLNGETTTGVTIFRLNERMDAGDVASEQSVAIEPGEDAQTLSHRLSRLGAEELLRVLDAVAEGRATFVPQDESRATLAPKLTKTDGRINWDQPATTLERLVRAMTPWPGAATSWRGRSLKIWKASLEETTLPPATTRPGTILRIDAEALVVASGRGVLKVAEVQPAGGRRMGIQAFRAGHDVHVGEILGESIVDSP